MVVGKSFVPNDDRSEFQVTVKAPEGTSLAATLTIAERMARDLREQKGVTATLTSIGSASGRLRHAWPPARTARPCTPSWFPSIEREFHAGTT